MTGGSHVKRALPLLVLVPLLVLASMLGCSRCQPAAEKAKAEKAPAATSPVVASPPGPVVDVAVKLGALDYVIPSRLEATRFSLEAPTLKAPKVVPDEVPLAPKSDPAWKYFAQLFVAPGTAETLASEGVAVDANAYADEFFQLYEQNRYRPLLISSSNEENEEGNFQRTFLAAVPSVVTPDVVLHNLHLFFDFALARAEEQTLAPQSAALVTELLTETKRQVEGLAGTPWADAAKDNLVLLEVARLLFGAIALKPPAEESTAYVGIDSAEQAAAFTALLQTHLPTLVDATLPDEVQEKVRLELARILAAKELVAVSIFAPPPDFKEDYTQYTPRGHYVKTTGLQAYFRAVMWLSRATMAFSSPQAVRSAELLTLAVSQKDSLVRWRRVFDAVTFLVGPPDDVTVADVLPVLAAAAKRGPLTSEDSFAAVQAGLAGLKGPSVQSTRTEKVSGPSLESQKGLHLFPQRAVIDAVLLQGLVDPQVPMKNRISALEVPAVLGSSLARTLVSAEELDALPGYAAQREKLQRELPPLLLQRATADFAAGWLSALGPLLRAPDASGPRFMRTDGFARLTLSTYLASYAELKHDTVLYAKQAAAEMGGPGFEDTEETIDRRGYVIPEVELYARAAALLRGLRKGLGERELFPAGLETSWARFETLTGRLEAISRKELAQEPLSEDDYHLIEFIGGDLEHFWEETLLVRSTTDRMLLLEQNNTRIIADIFTGPAGITHVASGWVHPVYVAFPREGKMAIGRGAVFSFYEVRSRERLSDQAWRARLRDRENRPALPTWTRPVFAFDPTKELVSVDIEE